MHHGGVLKLRFLNLGSKLILNTQKYFYEYLVISTDKVKRTFPKNHSGLPIVGLKWDIVGW